MDSQIASLFTNRPRHSQIDCYVSVWALSSKDLRTAWNGASGLWSAGVCTSICRSARFRADPMALCALLSAPNLCS